MGKKRTQENDNEYDPVSKHLRPAHKVNDEKRLIIILENAQLESVKVGNSFELLNCDDHANILKKNNRDLGSCRPDIVHQCLLMLLDSPLNRAGLLQVYVHTEKNILIEINPQTRIPRTFKRFAGLIVQLLHKFSVRASDGHMKLLKVIKNPVTNHLPVGCRKILTSYNAEQKVDPKKLVPSTDEPIVIVVGAMAHGQVSTDYTEDTVSISSYPLSGALACAKICTAFEEVWNVM
ncbi:ribosomal RNA small subunit methyltransferase NEP1 [Chelonus insularis]|uniref:ribosomal RNA small subunit methyltransferase NEP1 n=1 Tax=Chelonus insularis TaxID=460826 RepID=UPI00158CD97D|nr:ribosomal RNA small subunit methyltransferase NEP1 [Chelonus insularis]